MKLRWVVSLACVAACGGGPSPDEPRRLAFERWSPPQYTSRDVFLAARGDVVVMSRRISHDAGATWQPLDPSLGAPTRVAITGSTVALHAGPRGLVRWDLTTGAMTTAPAAPSYATDRTWRVEPAGGRFMAFDAVENAIAVEAGASWRTSKLPQPAATEVDPYVKDLESNGAVILTISAWGVHRSVDEGATWQLVTATIPNAGRDLLVLPDRRFMLLGGPTTYMFDAAGNPAGSMPGIIAEIGDAAVCEDGAIVAREKITRDFGATWQSLIAGGDLEMIVERVGCGGGRYWLLARSDAWGYRLVRFDGPGAPGLAAGNWEADGDPAWSANGPAIARADDGTFLVAGLAWREGDAGWSLREIPARTWASGAALFGIADDTFFTSHDRGTTWTARAAMGLPADELEAFAVAPDGAFLVSTFSGETVGTTDTWRSRVWRSSDGGATWAVAYDAQATRVDGGELAGEVHRFVGVAPDGAWIATDAVSHDAGKTWQPTDVKGDRSLAFLMPTGELVTTLPASTAKQDVWRVYANGGLGGLHATYAIEIEGELVPGSQLRSVAFDELGHAYVARGAPYAQIWRSREPLVAP